MNKTKLSILFVILAGLLSLALSKSEYYKNIAQSQKRINTVYKYIMSNYVDELNLDEFTKKSIDQMLENVDPYTVYMVEEEKSDLELLTHNGYSGIGVQIGKREGKLTVISPMDDGPAIKAGIISGDVIMKIDGKSAHDMSINDASNLIRGKKGTKVLIEIKRDGMKDLIAYELIRDEITVKFVSYYGKYDDKTGYIRLTRFGKNASDELETALKSLIEQNVENIVLDLRDNTGGLLQSALDILDLFIEKDELLLKTKGRISTANKEFFSKRDPIVPDGVKVAVLINKGSASASEIVAGTIQDLDRGILVGNNSFGKGLVQSIYPLDKKSTLKITTAKYYIPSGRLIQKPDYIDSAMVVDRINTDEKFYTRSGREVKGGGGLEPDSSLTVKIPGPLTQAIFRRGAFFTYVQKNKTKYSDFDEISSDAQLMEDFRIYLDTLDLDIILPGSRGIKENMAEMKSQDSTSASLLQAFDFIEKYFEKREKELFDEESRELRWRLLSEFKTIFESNEAGIGYSLKFDETVETAVKMMQDQNIYSHQLSSN